MSFRSLDLAVQFHAEASKMVLATHLKDQMLRAASSIALNLSEGNSRPTTKDKRHFFYTALGSCRECQTILKLTGVNDGPIFQLADQLGAHLFRLTRSDF